MSEAPSLQEKISASLQIKTVLKQDVFDRTKATFSQLKSVLTELAIGYDKVIAHDERVRVECRSQSDFEAKLKFGGDTLVFHMHTNVFIPDDEHPIWKLDYVKEDPYRSYLGVIYIYNFLSDSLRYNRFNDSGYLVARIFVNRDGKFFVEGKRPSSFPESKFGEGDIGAHEIREVLEEAILFTLDFDLLVPPYQMMHEVSVHEIVELTKNMKIKTAKRLGFQFSSDQPSIEG